MSRKGLTGLQVTIFFKQFNRAGDVAQLVTHLLSMHTSLDVILHPPTPQFWGKKKKNLLLSPSCVERKGNCI